MRRNKFSLSKFRSTTITPGKLVPINVEEVLPGDSIQQRTSALIRVTPLVTPVMHPLHVRINHFFVPNRLMWEDWEDFITGGPDGMDSTLHPYLDISSVTESSLTNYLGIPAGTYPAPVRFSALPFRAYNLIFNEYYRDQDLVDELPSGTESGQDQGSNQALQNVAWEKDYYTTARPWEQKGPQVTIPIAGTAPVQGTGDLEPEWHLGIETRKLSGGQSGSNVDWNSAVTSPIKQAKWADPKLESDLSQATGISINDLRLASALQRYAENRAQYGSRYIEYLRLLGVRSSDARLQNPEYLGGGRQTIQFSEVLQTADTVDGNVGELKGHGIAAMRTNRYRRFFEEHGLIVSLMSIVPKAVYMQAVDRLWYRRVKEDYFQKELQHIGDQEITNKEIKVDHTDPDGIFGYTSRYDEYRTGRSSVSSQFEGILNTWHYARDFQSDIALNQSFTDCVPTNRVYADQTSQPMICYIHHSIQARRIIAKRARTLLM